jgi:fructose-bisphosphate aldolase class I
MPSYTASANAHALARYAALCQDEGIVPIVEPEVLMDGDHDIDRCARSPTWVLKDRVRGIFYNASRSKAWCSSRTWWCPARSRQARSVEEVAEKTLRVLKACVPAAVPGIAFLSGGQSDEEATAHLDAMNKWARCPGG